MNAARTCAQHTHIRTHMLTLVHIHTHAGVDTCALVKDASIGRIVLVAGGTGVTPMLQIIYSLIHIQNQGQLNSDCAGGENVAIPSVSLLFANTRTDNIPLKVLPTT